MKRYSWSWIVVCAVTACGGQAIDVGSQNTLVGKVPPSTRGTDSVPLPTWPSPDACVNANTTLPLVGKWNGYYGRFANATADFQIDIRGVTATEDLCGTVTFQPGATPPPAATDGEVFYPAGATDLLDTYRVKPVPGFVYTILGSRAQGSLVDISIAPPQAWQGWCELQTSTYALGDSSPGRYSCLPPWASGPAAGGGGCVITDSSDVSYSVDCGKLSLCSDAPVCVCNDTRCVAQQATGDAFVLTVSGDEGSGQYAFRDVTLRRVP